MDKARPTSAAPTPAPVRTQEITMPEINVHEELRRQRAGNPELEARVNSLVGQTSPSATGSNRTTVHGTTRANHR